MRWSVSQSIKPGTFAFENEEGWSIRSITKHTIDNRRQRAVVSCDAMAHSGATSGHNVTARRRRLETHLVHIGYLRRHQVDATTAHLQQAHSRSKKLKI